MRLRSLSLAGAVLALVAVLGVLAQPPDREKGPGRRGGPDGPPPFGPMRLPLMSTLDTNGDGELSAEEIAAATENLKKLDRNKDGKLSREELFGQREGRPGPGGGRAGPGPGRSGSASFDNPPLPRDDAEKKLFQVIQDISREQGRRMNVPQQDGRMLRLLAEAVDAKKVVEIGTSNGISAIWFSMALRKTGGKLITHELDPRTADLAKKNFERAGVADLITVVVGDAHETVTKLKGPIDVVFIDADKEGYPDYLKKVLPLVRSGGLVLAHNISTRMANPEYVKAITTNADLETFFYLEGGGLSVSLKKR